jgi:hypothetical protein
LFWFGGGISFKDVEGVNEGAENRWFIFLTLTPRNQRQSKQTSPTRGRLDQLLHLRQTGILGVHRNDMSSSVMRRK